MFPLRLRTLALALVLVSLAAAAIWAAFALRERQVDRDLRAIVAAEGLTGDPSRGRELPSIDEPLAQLGKKLFFTKALSGDNDVACATCHHPLLGGGDNLSLSIGVGASDPDLLGPGRGHPDVAPNVPRNAPTTFNIAMWDQVMFHDGRLESLDKLPGANGAGPAGMRTPDTLPGLADPLAGENLVDAQSRFPVTSPAEMLGYSFATHKPHRTIRAALCARLGGYGMGQGDLPDSQWPAEFERVFGRADQVEALITDERIAQALGAYERSQVFVDTPWRRYVEGDDAAISDAAKRGALLFFREPAEGGAGCATCHSGDFFTDEQFYTLAVPQVGPGKRDDPYFDDPAVQTEDFGRWYATFDETQRYSFRTPTLLNVEVTGPYGHNGAYDTLEGIVRHHLDPAAAVAAYDPAQLIPPAQTARTAEYTAKALAKLEEDRRSDRTTLQDVKLSDRQVDELIAFLRALTDPCVKDPACLARWLPEADEPDPDGLQLIARFGPGKATQ
ncbi:MAG: cytochrome-c peroxidase [Anaerolineae bacterium]|jgi:cytochrome c peroxidase|nr:cytochrome-c peroxidase [Anaerolineae bacterium]